MRLDELDRGRALFLDDERHPPSDGYRWIVVRNFDQAKRFVEEHGMPSHASFDHDLGDGPSGYDFIKWLVEFDMENSNLAIPIDFTFRVHSQNPIGAANIKCYLSNYLELRHV